MTKVLLTFFIFISIGTSAQDYSSLTLGILLGDSIKPDSSYYHFFGEVGNASYLILGTNITITASKGIIHEIIVEKIKEDSSVLVALIESLGEPIQVSNQGQSTKTVTCINSLWHLDESKMIHIQKCEANKSKRSIFRLKLRLEN